MRVDGKRLGSMDIASTEHAHSLARRIEAQPNFQVRSVVCLIQSAACCFNAHWILAIASTCLGSAVEWPEQDRALQDYLLGEGVLDQAEQSSPDITGWVKEF